MERKEIVERLLKGAYDLHMHAAPSPFGRAMDDYGLLQEADAAGMGGIMLKSHYESTAARAQLVNAHGGCTAKAFGGIVLNWPVGGLNPYAVAAGLKMGVRIVWMPTRDSENCLKYGHMNGDFFDRPPISIWDENVDLEPKEMTIFSPTEPWKRQTLENIELKPLLVPIFVDGKKVYESPSIEEIKTFCAQQIDTLWDEVKRLEYPHIYYVDYSEKLWLEQMRLLNEKQNG